MHSRRRVVTNESLEGHLGAPAPLNLPFGKLFFGYKVIPYSKASKEVKEGHDAVASAFAGTGNTLSSRSPVPQVSNGRSAASTAKGKEPETAQADEARWGRGQTLSGPSSNAFTDSRGRSTANPNAPVGAGGARVPQLPVRAGRQQQRERSPTPDWGVDDEDVIEIDSD